MNDEKLARIKIRTPKMKPSQYAPMFVPVEELEDTIKHYEAMGYSVEIVSKEVK